jgi:hypothetical protein
MLEAVAEVGHACERLSALERLYGADEEREEVARLVFIVASTTADSRIIGHASPFISVHQACTVVQYFESHRPTYRERRDFTPP